MPVLTSMHKCRSYGPYRYEQMQAQCMHNAHTYTEVVTTVSLTASGLDKKDKNENGVVSLDSAHSPCGEEERCQSIK